MATAKLKVFISSAMDNEPGINWKELRGKIYTELENDGQFEPFRIENEASPEGSRQLYLSELESSDIVVCSIGGDLRQGTRDEIEKAFELKKYVFLYLLPAERTEQAEKFIGEVRDGDLCTYKILENPLELAPTILSNIKSHLTRIAKRVAGEGQFDEENLDISDPLMFKRATLKHFSACIDWAFKTLALPPLPANENKGDGEESSLVNLLGRQSLEWLFFGKPFPLRQYDAAIEPMLGNVNLSKCSQAMRKACNAAIDGNYENAMTLAQDALCNLEDNATWLKGVGLIDARNFSLLNRQMDEYFRYQKLIDGLESAPSFPPGNFFLLEARKSLSNLGEWKRGISNEGQGTSNEIYSVITGLANYLFAAVLFGSYAHMCNARRELASCLLALAKIYGEPALAYQSLRLHVVAGNKKAANNICNNDWNLIANFASSRADELWVAANEQCREQTEEMKCFCIERFAPYFSDSVFNEASRYATAIAISRSNIASLRGLKSVSQRLPMDDLALCIATIINDGKYPRAAPLNSMLHGIEFNNLGQEPHNQLTNAIASNWQRMLERGFSFESLATLISEGHLPSSISDEVKATLGELDKSIFDFQAHKREDANLVLKEALNAAGYQLHTNKNAGVTVGFYEQPGKTISILLKGTEVSQVDATTVDSFSDIAKKVCESEGDRAFLSGYINCLIDFVAYCSVNDISLSDGFLESVSAIDESIGTNSEYGFQSISSSAWSIQVVVLKSLCGIYPFIKIFDSFLRQTKEDYSFDKVVVMAMPSIVSYATQRNSKDVQALKLILFKEASSAYKEIRQLVPSAITQLDNKDTDMFIQRILTRLSQDEQPLVRSSALQASLQSNLSPKFKKELLDLHRNDAHFQIRRYVKRELETLMSPSL